MCESFNVVLIEHRGVFNGENDAALHNSMRETYVERGGWYVICDLDEFHDPPGGVRLIELSRLMESDGASCVTGLLLDRVARDGTIPPKLNFNLSLAGQFPMMLNITKEISGGVQTKVLMAKQHIPVLPGHHTCNGVCWNNEGVVHHVKWFGKVVEETHRRALAFKSQNLCYQNQSQRLSQYFFKSGERFPVERLIPVSNDPIKIPMSP